MSTTYNPSHGQASATERRPGLFITMLQRIDSAISFLFGSIIRSAQMASEYERLSRLSDKGLAARGITREDIPQYLVKRYLD